MKIQIIGGGGREHALAWKLSTSPLVHKIICTPGNAGISEIAECIDAPSEHIDKQLHIAQHHTVDLVIVGPEAPLAAGICDRFRYHGIPIIGPSQSAAILEKSKAFTKQLCLENDIPTPAFDICYTLPEAEQAIKKRNGYCAVKADGLTGGKGSYVCQNTRTAYQAVAELLIHKRFGDAGIPLIIEDLLTGQEVSIIAFCHQNDFILLAHSQDHKPLEEGNHGPNTGGMGAYSPVSFIDNTLQEKISSKIIKPTLEIMTSRGTPFSGFLYAGLMISDGSPYLLEFNVRLGDPETQVILPRLENDLMELFHGIAMEDVSSIGPLHWTSNASVCVVLAKEGYPYRIPESAMITGMNPLQKPNNIHLFHSGTRLLDGNLITSSGRVFGVTALGPSIDIAREEAYRFLEQIHFNGKYYRRDIAANITT